MIWVEFPLLTFHNSFFLVVVCTVQQRKRWNRLTCRSNFIRFIFIYIMSHLSIIHNFPFFFHFIFLLNHKIILFLHLLIIISILLHYLLILFVFCQLFISLFRLINLLLMSAFGLRSPNFVKLTEKNSVSFDFP